MIGESIFLFLLQFVLSFYIFCIDLVLLCEYFFQFANKATMGYYFLNKYISTFPAFLPGRFWTLTEQANFYFSLLANVLMNSSASYFGMINVYNPMILVMFLLFDFYATIWIPLNVPSWKDSWPVYLSLMWYEVEQVFNILFTK